MKRNYFSYFLLSIVFVMGMMVSCTKEGPAGKDGAPGKDGEDGIDGKDGTAGCVQCHDNTQVNFSKTLQWEASTHATGGNFERAEGECAICHTSQGFLGNLDGTYDWEADGAMISNPNPQNCYTCHNIHSTYTPEDYAFTKTDAVVLNNTGGSTYDFGKANLCASCHQARTLDPWPVIGGDDVAVTSAYYGLHHGPQANTFSGMGLWEDGSVSSDHAHKSIENGCVTCHMAEPYGVQAGGHSMKMGYDYHGHTVLNTAGCVACHSDAATLAEEYQAEIAAKLAELKTLLDGTGITVDGDTHPVPGTYAPEVVGAFLDFQSINEDRSLGVHNPTYISGVLDYAISVLQ